MSRKLVIRRTKPIIVPKTWGSIHTHSHYSALDGTTRVPELVAKAEQLGYPFLGLSDHGNMAGATKLYTECRARGILPYPGVEAYLLDPFTTVGLEDKEASKIKRYHLGLYARTTRGYQGLVKLVSLTHTRPRFSRYPRMTFADLLDFGEVYGDDVILTTGCFFGLIQQMLIIHQDTRRAQDAVDTFKGFFPHTFVEVQNHGIEHSPGMRFARDDDLVDALFDIAETSGLPVIATQDNHYLDKNHKAAHRLMKQMVYSSAEDGFPGDSFHLASEEWVQGHYADWHWDRVLEGSKILTQLNEVSIPPLDTYTVRMPKIEAPTGGTLSCFEWLCWYCEARVPGSSDQRYHDRIKEELSVIGDLGMANYFVHVFELVEWCRTEGIFVEARGSANGSYVCFLLGITQVDPIKYGTMFERFLSRDRIKPPDIDLDVEDARRGEILEYLGDNFPTVRIGTWGLLGSNDAGQGSILRTYQTYRARLAAEAGDEEGRKDAYKLLRDLNAVAKQYPEEIEPLRALDRMGSVYRSYGVHASGVLLGGEDFTLEDWIPTMLVASSETPVTQFDQDDVEKWGLLKDDILGQKTLTVMRRCQEHLGKDDPTDFTWIPDDDPRTLAVLREGRVDTGIFHFEGWTKSRGAKELAVRHTRDVILAQALYMPGAMESGEKDKFVARRRNRNGERDQITYIHKAFEKVLRHTYGAVIFQEQVIQIMRNLGMSIESINVFFKVVKDSGRGAVGRNQERIKAVRDEFNDHCLRAGIPKDKLDEAWEQTAGFVSYGFNFSHATGYGIRSYRCAYLKTHYPLEFMAALLEAWSGTDKEEVYLKEIRYLADKIKRSQARNKPEVIKILRPHVNHSGEDWTLDRAEHGIRKGLRSIDRIGPAAAPDIAKNAPYTSVEDLITRCKGRSVSGGPKFLKEGVYSGALAELEKAGALRDLPERETVT